MGTIGRCVAGIGVTALVLLAATESRAQTQTLCGSTPSNEVGWNVPNGDAVFVSGPGPIYSVLSAVGEYRSHSMLSNGPNGSVTHATSTTPPANGNTGWYAFTSNSGSTGDSECYQPISPGFLEHSTPGLEQVNDAAIYTFLYDGSTENYIGYQGTATAANAATIGNFALAANADGLGKVNVTDGSNSYFGITYGGNRVYYGWNQYYDIQSVNVGNPSFLMPGPGSGGGGSYGSNFTNWGVECASSLSMWQYDAIGKTAAPRTYTAGTQLTNAANALWNAVNSECNGSNGWFSSFSGFFTNLGWSTVCAGTTGWGQGLCGQAADEIVDCFTDPYWCQQLTYDQYFWGGYFTAHDDGQTLWQYAVANWNSVAVSPDDMALSSSTSSAWGGQAASTPQWNSGGSTYGCWD